MAESDLSGGFGEGLGHLARQRRQVQRFRGQHHAVLYARVVQQPLDDQPQPVQAGERPSQLTGQVARTSGRHRAEGGSTCRRAGVSGVRSSCDVIPSHWSRAASASSARRLSSALATATAAKPASDSRTAISRGGRRATDRPVRADGAHRILHPDGRDHQALHERRVIGRHGDPVVGVDVRNHDGLPGERWPNPRRRRSAGKRRPFHKGAMASSSA